MSRSLLQLIKNFDLNLLIVLREMLRNPNTTHVAKKLGKTQSSISQSLKKLRDNLNDPLFIRSGAKMVPTAFCEGLKNEIEAITQRIEFVINSNNNNEAWSGPTDENITFHLSGTDLSGSIISRHLTRRMEKNTPNVKLFNSFYGDEVEDAIQKGYLDLAIGGTFNSLSGVIRKKIVTDHFVLIAAKGNPVLKENLSLECFCKLKHTIVSPRGKPGGIIDRKLEELEASRELSGIFFNFYTAAITVENGDMVCVIPNLLARFFKTKFEIDMKELPFESPTFTLSMIYSEAKRNERNTLWLAEEVLKAFQL